MYGKLQDSMSGCRHKLTSTHWRGFRCKCHCLDLREWAHGCFAEVRKETLIQKENTAVLCLKLFVFIENCPYSIDGKLPLDFKSCTENAAVFLKPCFDRLSCFSQKFDFSWNMHSKCVYFIIRKKTKIALQVLLCFAIALYLIKLVSLEMNAFSAMAFIFIVVFAGFSVTDSWQSHKFWVNIATPDGKYSAFKVSCCKDKKYQKTGCVDDGLTLGSGYNKVPEAKPIQYLRCLVPSSSTTSTVTFMEGRGWF